MTSEGRSISFANSASNSKGGPRSKENGPDFRVVFAVDDIDDTLEKLRKRGAHLVGEVVQYKDAYRLCYIRGPEGLLIRLAQELS
jgi:predicted enzyme related to lactoylglutathione lyase